MSGGIWLLLSVLLVISPLLLKLHVFNHKIISGSSVFDKKSYFIVGIFSAIALSLPNFGFGDPDIVWGYFFAQTLVFFSFISVSRMRQRGSAFLHALASIPSNAIWFVNVLVLAEAYAHTEQTLHSFVFSKDFVGLLVSGIVAALVGRLVGAQWMQWVEKTWQVRTDSVGSPMLKWLDTRTLPTLGIAFIICPIVFVIFGLASVQDVLLVMALGCAQSGIYALNTRLANRNHPGWPVVTGLLGSIIFTVHRTYLLGYTDAGSLMPLSLLIPYTIATMAGSNTGAFISMWFEKVKGIKADVKATDKNAFRDVTWHRYLLVVMAAICLAALLGRDMPVALLIAGIFFFIDSITHNLSSRAGNRNHAPYHALTCVLHGLVSFVTASIVILDRNFLDLIPVVAFGGALGQLYAQKISMKVEERLQSVMDVPPESVKARA